LVVVYRIMSLGSFGQDDNGWQSFQHKCPLSTKRWRLLPDGKIEIEGEGAPVRAWPNRVDDWRSLINKYAAQYDLQPAWIAAIMAIESGGKPDVCFRPGGPGSPCSTADGAGLMAMLKSTATALAGRTVELQELMDDPELAVDLGAKLIRRHSDKYAGEFLHMAVAYNAGSPRCAPAGKSGNTVQKPKEPCPPTPWGIIMGCVRTSHSLPGCAPSTVSPGMFACPNMYPERAIGSLNAAITTGDYATNPGAVVPPPPVPTPTPAPPPIQIAKVAPLTYVAALAAGATAGFFTVRWLGRSGT